MIETVKLVGSIVGLLVGVFTAWDRLVRGRPLASLAMTGSPTNAYRSIRVKNISQIDILITNVVAYPRQFKIAKNESVFGIGKAVIVSAMMNHRGKFVFWCFGANQILHGCHKCQRLSLPQQQT